MKVVIADPKNGKCYQTEIDETKGRALMGLKTGDSMDGAIFGLEGFRLRITGGTDSDGFPMRPDVHGAERKRILLSSGPGFKPSERGERRKKTVRGNVVSADIAQLNIKISVYGTKSVAEVFGKAETKEEKKTEEKTEGK